MVQQQPAPRLVQAPVPQHAPTVRRVPTTLVWGALSTLGLLALWQFVAVYGGYPAFILPTPALVAERWLAEWQTGTLQTHTLITLIEATAGFGMAFGVSLVLGYWLAHAPRLERVVAPQLAASQAIPVVAVAPLIMLWVGTDIWSKILVAALVTFFPMLSATVAALRAVPRELREMAQISGANRWQLIRYVELPLALPGIFAGIKTGLALATTGAVVGEFVAGSAGLGALINIARGLFDTPLLFAALGTLAVLTLGFYLAATLLERALVRWEA